MKKHLLYRAALAITLLSAISFTAHANPRNTGIHGQVFHYISYGVPHMIAPDVWIGIPSVQRPVPTSFTLLSAHNGRQIARIQTDAIGQYSISVPPGRYVLVPDILVVNAFFNCTVSLDPIEVEVKPKQFTFQNVFYFSQGPICPINATNSVIIQPANP